MGDIIFTNCSFEYAKNTKLVKNRKTLYVLHVWDRILQII